MFLTLILQYLNKLVERKIGDFTSPQAFHTVKVQFFNGDCIKLLTEFRSELPVKVFALVADLPIQACDSSNTPPPAVRTLNLSRKTFVERPKFVQGAFQGLWVLFLLTRAQRQICVFHTGFGLGIDQIHSLYYIVCPDTLTRRGQRFRFYKIGEDVQPILTAGITFDRNTADISFKLTVLMERIRNFIILPLTRPRIPFTQRQRDTVIFQRPTRLFQREGLKLMAFFDFRSTPEFLEKTDIRLINTPQLLLDRLTRQRFPMRVGGAFQLGHMCTHCRITRIRQSVLIPVTLPLMEIFMHLPHIVKQVTQTYTIRLIIKWIFVGFHGISHITPFNPYPVGWQTRHQAVTLDMFASVIVLSIPQFYYICQVFTPHAVV